MKRNHQQAPATSQHTRGPSTYEAYMAGQTKNEAACGLHRFVQRRLLAALGSKFSSHSSLPPPQSTPACASKESAPGSTETACRASQRVATTSCRQQSRHHRVAVMAVSLTLVCLHNTFLLYACRRAGAADGARRVVARLSRQHHRMHAARRDRKLVVLPQVAPQQRRLPAATHVSAWRVFVLQDADTCCQDAAARLLRRLACKKRKRRLMPCIIVLCCH